MRMSSRAIGVGTALAVAVALRLTAAGDTRPAFQVRDIGTTVNQSGVGSDFVAMDGALYFVSSDGIHGSELWRSDGTRAGTRMLKDLCPGICSSTFYLLDMETAVLRHRLYWTAWDGEHWVLVATDGTPEGTAPVFDADSAASGRELIPFGEIGGEVLLSGLVPGQPGGELWKTDGTEAGTVLLRTFRGSFPFSRPAPQGQVGDVFLFSAEDGRPGTTLWRTDGTTEGTVRVFPDSLNDSLYIFPYGVAGGRLFFRADSGQARGIWVSDGTPAGTHPLRHNGFDTTSGTIAVLGDQVFFGGYDGAGRRVLWKSDGTDAGTGVVKELDALDAVIGEMAE